MGGSGWENRLDRNPTMETRELVLDSVARW